MYIKARNTVEIFTTNQFNINFATMSTRISHLNFIDGNGAQESKIFARTDDGVTRFISPVTGRTLSANLPMVESETILDVAYYLQTNRMYVLLSSGDIWTFRTDQNPCTIVDLWNSLEGRRENSTHLAICHGQLTQEDLKICPPHLKTFGILISATKNGHILIYGRGGMIMDRYQLHTKGISQLAYVEKTHNLISAGLDGLNPLI
jgi:hypothetical protein